MKKIDGEKIIEALHVIKEVCECYDGCDRCPLEVKGVCGVIDLQPQNWKISEYRKFQALE